jgi:hypothetical protein
MRNEMIGAIILMYGTMRGGAESDMPVTDPQFMKAS